MWQNYFQEFVFIYVNNQCLFVGNSMECAVCLQTCVHPARLPCSHVFCYLCVKGVANQSKKCPMCRQEIPPDFVDKPNLIEVEETKQPAAVVEDEYQWFYEGRNGKFSIFLESTRIIFINLKF